MLIAQITDAHIKADGGLAYRKVDTIQFLENVIAHINAFTPKIDAVIATGDLTDAGRPEEMAVLRACLDQLRVPCYVIPGNHDVRETMISGLEDKYLQTYDAPSGQQFIQYAVDDFPLRLVALDSITPGQPYGSFCAERLDWLDQELQKDQSKQTLVFMHHPPFEVGIHHMDVQNQKNADAFWGVVKRHKHVRQIVCGHIHRAVETMMHGVPVSIGPNGAHSVSLDLVGEAPLSFSMEPTAIRLFRFDESNQLLMSHLTYIGDYDGPHPFYEPDGALID